MSGEKVCVTGLGCFCSIGSTVSSFWKNLLAGDSGVGILDRFPREDIRSPMAAEAPEPGGEETARVDRMALRASGEALKEAGFGMLPDGAGIALGASVGGLPESEETYRAFLEDGRLHGRLRPFLSHCPSNTSDLLALRWKANGPRATIVNACASGTAALGLASSWIRSGETDCVIAGGCDALARLTVGGFNILRLVSEDKPKPFDANRSGMVVGEGAAFLVLESAAGAASRNHPPLATIDGWGFSSDGYHVTAPHPEGDGALQAMRETLRVAGVNREWIDHVNAHGTGTKANDDAEAVAIGRLLGGRVSKVPVVSIKGAVGHTLGAAGAIEAVAATMSLLHQRVPPNTNLEIVSDNISLFLPRKTEERRLRSVLSVNLAFGGNNAAVLFGRVS